LPRVFTHGSAALRALSNPPHTTIFVFSEAAEAASSCRPNVNGPADGSLPDALKYPEADVRPQMNGGRALSRAFSRASPGGAARTELPVWRTER